MTVNNMVDQLRVEKKCPLNMEQLHLFRAWHKKYGNHFQRAFDDRIVNSIYFDTVDFRGYHENIEGQAKRKKIRLRWYGPTRAPEQARLEIKKRINNLNCKDYQLLDMANIAIDPLATLFSRLRKDLNPMLRHQLHHILKPTVFNQYSREYYASQSNIRLTVDTDLKAEKLVYQSTMLQSYSHRSIAAVLELKYLPEQEDEFHELMDAFPFRHTRNSKYISAMQDF